MPFKTLLSKFFGIFLRMGKISLGEISYKFPTLARKVTNP